MTNHQSLFTLMWLVGNIAASQFQGSCLCGVSHVLIVSVWVFSGFSGFPPNSRKHHSGWICYNQYSLDKLWIHPDPEKEKVAAEWMDE